MLLSRRPAFALGLTLPPALQILPIGEDLHLILLAIWQPSSLYVGMVLWLLSLVVKHIAPTRSRGKRSKVDKEGLDHAYSFEITVGALTNWDTLGTTLAAKFAPDLFPRGVAEHLTLCTGMARAPLRRLLCSSCTSISTLVRRLVWSGWRTWKVSGVL